MATPPADEPLILISNDDGIDAPGIRALTSALDGLGQLMVVAPAQEQSAVGHAITVRLPVRARAQTLTVPSGHVEGHAVTGTPADCIKLAVTQLVPRQPDLVVSGINRGPNTAVNVIYSGTVSAATEAAILGIDAMAVSLCKWEADDAHDYEASGRFARRMAERVLSEGLPPGVLLNINVPAIDYRDIRGVAVTRQAKSRWEEAFEERKDPLQRPYYWMAGRFVNLDEGDNTDIEAVDNGYVSVTPLQLDLTAHSQLEALKKWDW